MNIIDLVKERDRIAKEDNKAGVVGEVGLWWIINNKVYQDSDPINLGTDVFTPKNDHIGYWLKLQRAYPEFQGTKYNHYQRGRVSFSKSESMFYIKGSKEFFSNEKWKNLIISAFNLPQNHIKFVSDSHYDI